jgi:hypothetical protein
MRCNRWPYIYLAGRVQVVQVLRVASGAASVQWWEGATRKVATVPLEDLRNSLGYSVNGDSPTMMSEHQAREVHTYASDPSQVVETSRKRSR